MKRLVLIFVGSISIIAIMTTIAFIGNDYRLGFGIVIGCAVTMPVIGGLLAEIHDWQIAKGDKR